MDIAELSLSVKSDSAVKATRDLEGLNRAGVEAEKATDRLARTMAKLGAFVGIGALAKQFLDVNVEFQRLAASLNTVEGSSDRAAVAFEKLKRFAQDTPFALTEVTQAYIALKNRGLDASQDALKKYADAAGALGINLMDSIMTVNSAVAGETESIKRWGFTMTQAGERVILGFGDMKRTVQRDGLAIQKAILEMTAARFAGGSDRMMKTLGGQISNLGDAWAVLLAKIGGSGLGDTAGRALAALTDLLSDFQSKMDEVASDPSWWEFVGSFELMGRQIAGLTGQIGEMGGAVAEAGVKTGFFSRIWQGVALLVAGVRDTITYMRNLWGEFFSYVAQRAAEWVENVQTIIMAVPKALRNSVGFTDEAEAALSNLVIKAKANAGVMGKLVTDMQADSGSAYQEVIDGIMETQAMAIKRSKEYADNLKRLKELAEAGGDPGKPGSGKGALNVAMLQRQMEFIKALQKEAETLGFTTMELKRYEAARVGLANNPQVDGYLKKIQDWTNSQRDFQEKFARGMRAADEYSASMDRLFDEQAQSIEAALDAVYPYRQELEELGKTYEALHSLRKDSLITESQFSRVEDQLIRKTQELQVFYSKAFGDMTQTVRNWTSDAANAFVDFAFGAEVSIKKMVNAMLKDLARLAAQQAFNKMVLAWFGNKPAPASNSSLPGGTNGADFVPYSGAAAPGGGASPVSIGAIHINDSGVSVEGGKEGNAKALGAALGAAMRVEIMNQKRPGGLLATVRG